MTERRKFLTQCGAVVATTVLAPRTLLAQSLSGAETMSLPGGPGKDEFTAMLRSSFYLHDASAENQAQVMLVEVLDYPSSAGLEQFGLVFKGPAETPLPEGLYTASGWDKAPFQIFIKPTEGDARRQYYVADFSLLH